MIFSITYTPRARPKLPASLPVSSDDICAASRSQSLAAFVEVLSERIVGAESGVGRRNPPLYDRHKHNGLEAMAAGL